LSGSRLYVALTHRLVEAGVDRSVDSVGDAYRNALAESEIGLYKTELARPEGPWRDAEHVEVEHLRIGRRHDTPRGRVSLRCKEPAQA
jgi:transposase InsO family protein